MQINLYVPDVKERVWKDFKTICEREGESASEKILEFISRYVDRHRHGNPQTMIKRWIPEETKPKPSKGSVRVRNISEKPDDVLLELLADDSVNEYDKQLIRDELKWRKETQVT